MDEKEKTQAIDNIICSKQRKVRDRKEMVHFIVELSAVLLICFMGIVFFFGISFVDGDSMLPAIRDGDIVIYYRLQSSYSIGDVVAFKDESGRKYIKRVTAVSGDNVEIINDILYVNGESQTNNIFFDTKTQKSGNVKFPLLVPENQVFVLGDHRTNSVDSRSKGCISIDDTLGKVITCIRVANF